MDFEKDAILSMYERIIYEEYVLAGETWRPEIFEKELVYDAVWQIFEVAKQSAILRSFNRIYNLSDDLWSYESVGAHVNLASQIMDQVLALEYGLFTKTSDGYDYQDILKAVRRHDLPENDIGDEADNGDRNDEELIHEEIVYWQEFSRRSPCRDYEREKRIMKLLLSMQYKSSKTGKMLYLADKVSANIMALCLDMLNLTPLMSIDDPEATELDLLAMKYCDWRKNGFCKASEMWAVGWFETRADERIIYDETGIITAFLIMATLTVNFEWYNWRRKDYLN